MSDLHDLISVLQAFEAQSPDLERIGLRLAKALREGHKILTCGNGGSATDAMHLAEELSGRYKGDRPALAAHSLCSDASAITCICNDYGYEQVFSRQVEALGKAGDVLVGISTSGNSENVLRAIAAAKALGMHSVLLGGKGGGLALERADDSLVVPSDSTARIQEVHTFVLHQWLEIIEHELGYSSP